MKRITIKEIAKRAGVSIGTVDRVLHKRGEVSKKTAALVEKVALEGNYQANVIARGLKLKQENNIAVLLPNDNEYWQSVNEGVANELEEVTGIGMTISSFLFDRNENGSFVKHATEMIESKPDGVILAPILESESLDICKQLDEVNIPYLLVDSSLDGVSPLAFVGQDSSKAGYLAAKLLNYGFKGGHQAYIVRIEDFDSLNKTIDERVKGFRRFYHDHSFDPWLVEELSVDGEFNELKDLVSQCTDSQVAMHLFVPNSRSFEIGRYLSNTSVDYRIVGFDLIKENNEALRSGKVDFIIDQNPVRQGSEAIRSFYRKNIVKEEVSDLLMPLTIYTSENLP